MSLHRRYALAAIVICGLAPLSVSWSAEPPKAKSRLAALPVLDHVRFYPATGYERDMLGGRVSGSNVSATQGFELLATIESVPPAGQWTELSVPAKRPYRWLRYDAPPGSYGHISKLQFFAGKRRLLGQGFGSVGGKRSGFDYMRVFDAKDTKFKLFFDADTPDGHYVGIDVGDLATASRPKFEPPPAYSEQPLRVEIRSSAGAAIRYTLDGTLPTVESGSEYSQPLEIAKTTTLVAAAFEAGLATSPASDGTFLIAGSAKPGLSTFHVGNSLTQSTNKFGSYAETAGYRPEYHRYVKPGIWTCDLWEKYVAPQAEDWQQTLKEVTRVDHFTVQPRDPDVAHEAKYDILFFDLVRKQFPEMQPWFYSEWTSRLRNREWDRGLVPSTQMQAFPAFTWEESAAAMLLYNEDLRDKVVATYKQGKRPRVLPTVLAAGWIKHLLEHGKIPGFTGDNFYEVMFHEGVHPGPIGAYLIDLVWYSAFYRESPEGKVLPIGTRLNTAQSMTLQRLAWDIVKNYPDCGVYAEGTAPVSPPEFSIGAKSLPVVTRVELKSQTPGAWFRYTLDGTTPTRTRGYVYCGVVSVQPGMTLKAVAYKSGMADSSVSEASYPSSVRAAAVPKIPDNVVLERDIQYGQAGDAPLLLDIVRPRAESAQPRPVILFIHGGGWLAGDKASAIGLLIPYAASGDYFCATANYRLSDQAPWPAHLHDCKAAIRWLKGNAKQLNIDPERIGIWGHSAGGHLVSMLGLTGGKPELEGQSGSSGIDSRVACVVDMAGPSDFTAIVDSNTLSPILIKLFGGPIQERRELVRQASPVTHVSASAPPMLIVHGTEDPLVPLSQAERLHAALTKAGGRSKFIKLVGGGHGIQGEEISQRIQSFFARHLLGQDIAVSDEPIQVSAPAKKKQSK